MSHGINRSKATLQRERWSSHCDLHVVQHGGSHVWMAEGHPKSCAWPLASNAREKTFHCDPKKGREMKR